MSDILRIYDPAECDAAGVPLDFEKCRTCDGTGRYRDVRIWGTMPGSVICEVCGGYGSLRAAALAHLAGRCVCGGEDSDGRGDVLRCPVHGIGDATPRCEACQHPMSEGAWTHRPIEIPAALKLDPISPLPSEAEVYRRAMEQALRRAREGNEPASFGLWDAIHYSRCDEKCRHTRNLQTGRLLDLEAIGEARAITVYEASWRPVDVRCMSWPHDLRPENLKVLCLRCYAEANYG